MEFEEMKVIWDSQNEEPLFAVNQHGLELMLEKKARAFNRFIFWQEAQSYIAATMVVALSGTALIGYFTGGLERLKGVPMTKFDGMALCVSILAWLFFAFRVYFGRRKQRSMEQEETHSLLAEVERDIAKVEFEIHVRKLPVLISGFIPPHIGGILFTWVVFRASGLPGWSILPFIAVMLFGFYYETKTQLGLVKGKLEPRKRELENLHKKLLESAQ